MKFHLIYVCVWKEEDIKGKMKPERIDLESSLAGTGLEAPGQKRLSRRGMQRTTDDSCLHADGSSDLGGTIFLQAIKPDNQSSLFVLSCKTSFYR